jgi:hypothetical protein
MSSKNINNQCQLKNFVIVADKPELTIFSESGETTTVYNPKKDSDLAKLCKAASLEEFIKDNEKAEYPHLLVFESGRYARGVVANEPIKKNQIICEYLGEIDSLDAVVDRDRVTKLLTEELVRTSKGKSSFESLDKAIDDYIKHVSAYAFELKRKSGPNDCMLAHKKRSLAAFINHHTTDPNVHVDVVKKSIRFIASRNIEKGEQLRIDYGPDYEYEERMYYIPSSENHLRRGKFLAENLQHYHETPLELSKMQKIALGAESDFVMIPKFLLPLLSAAKVKKKLNATGYELRLPILEVLECSKKQEVNAGYNVYVPEKQQNIMPLLFVCARQHGAAITALVEDPHVDIFVKTIEDRDALIVLLKSIKSEVKFMQLAKPILQIIASNVKRIDYLGSDNYQHTALHIIVERGWSKCIKWFDRKTFFSVIDMQDFDPLMLAIAQGKETVLQELFKLTYVKRHLRGLLLIKEDLADDDCDYVLKRALRQTPAKKYKIIASVILRTVKKFNPSIEKKIKEIVLI